jgi:hypothetical protein
VPTTPITAPIEPTGFQGNTQLNSPITPEIQPVQQGGGVISGIFGGSQNVDPMQLNLAKQEADRQRVMQQIQLQRQNQFRPSLAQNKTY